VLVRVFFIYVFLHNEHDLLCTLDGQPGLKLGAHTPAYRPFTLRGAAFGVHCEKLPRRCRNVGVCGIAIMLAHMQMRAAMGITSTRPLSSIE
jgi:hypothetical protein